MTILFKATRLAAIVLAGASFGLFYSTLANASDRSPKAQTQMQKQGVKQGKAQASSTKRAGRKNSKSLRRTRKPGNTSTNLDKLPGKETLNGRSLLGGSTSSQKTQSGKLSNNGRALNANVLDIGIGLELNAARSHHRVVVQNGRLFLEPATTSLED